MQQTNLNNFYNAGFGWICRKCENKKQPAGQTEKSRLWSEGEAESKSPELSNSALARWTDLTRKKLICPQCGTVERIK